MSMYTQLVRLKYYPQPTQSFRQYVSAVPLQAQLSAQTLLWFKTTALHFPQFNLSNHLQSELTYAQLNSFANFKAFLGWMSDHHTPSLNKQDNTKAYRTYRATLDSKRRIRKRKCSLHICVLQARLYLKITLYLFISLHASTKRDSNVTQTYL